MAIRFHHGRRGLLPVAIPAILLCGAGCVSFPLESARPTSRTTGAAITTIVKSSSNEVDEVVPVVWRTGERRAELKIDLIGDIMIRETTDVNTTYGAREKMSFGFFPGAACDESGGEKIGSVLLALWYNIILAGTPTLSGLFVEPFIPTEVGQGSRFSRSALFGFHRWVVPSTTKREMEEKTMHRNRVRLNGFTCRTAEVGTSVSVRGETVEISNLDPKAESLDVTLALSRQHPLKEEMRGFEGSRLKIYLGKE